MQTMIQKCWKLSTVTLPGELRQLLTQVRLDDPGHLQVGHDFTEGIDIVKKYPRMQNT